MHDERRPGIFFGVLLKCVVSVQVKDGFVRPRPFSVAERTVSRKVRIGAMSAAATVSHEVQIGSDSVAEFHRQEPVFIQFPKARDVLVMRRAAHVFLSTR